MSIRDVRVASDVGGTFTDNIAYDEATRTITVAKVSTTPENRALGTIAGLEKALALQGKTGAAVKYVGHGMTTATNAVIQRQGARTAFITNAGFRDLLLIGRQARPSLYDIRVTRTPPLVAREHCLTVRGRLDAAGREVEPLAMEDLEAAARAIQSAGIEAVAICFLHSYANPVHERLARQFLEQRLKGVVVCASTDTMAEFREYERASTCVLNAFLMPVMDRYLGSLTALLRDAADGLGIAEATPVMVMEASGGLMTIASARRKPVHTVLSGPAGGVVASAHVAQLAGVEHIITMDIGGTSTDISVIRNGVPAITRDAKLEEIPVRLPVIDINAIGAGGGSIAWLDDGGALRVGPISAEAVPGPACYRRGGTRPTATDANVVLGRFGPDTRLGGEMTLDAEASHRAIHDAIAAPLGLDVVSAAAGILRVTHANIVRGIRVVSIERGYDPRDFALMPFGGAGPMHGTPVARELRIPRLLIPPTPGILCALGQLVSDLRHDLIETHIGPHAAFDGVSVEKVLNQLRAHGNELLAADGVADSRRRIDTHVDARYSGQSYELTLPLAGAAQWPALPQAFHLMHQARFGHHDAACPLEIVNFGVTAVGLIDAPELPQIAPGAEEPPAAALAGSRRVFFEADDPDRPGAWHETRVYRREALLAGNRVRGPAVIEEISATTVLYPDDLARVDGYGSMIVGVAA
jgi:N-methylhydantoinase A